MKTLKALLLFALLTAASFAQNNVTVNQTVPIWYHPNQSVYPGSDSTVTAFLFYFNGIENYQYAQVWMFDVVSGKYIQKTTIGEFIDDGLMLNNVLLPFLNSPPPSGKLVLMFYDTYTHIAANGLLVAPYPNFLATSNVFTFSESRLPIVGASANLGTAPCPPNCSPLTGLAVATAEAKSTILVTPLPAPIRKGHTKHHGKK